MEFLDFNQDPWNFYILSRIRGMFISEPGSMECLYLTLDPWNVFDLNPDPWNFYILAWIHECLFLSLDPWNF